MKAVLKFASEQILCECIAIYGICYKSREGVLDKVKKSAQKRDLFIIGNHLLGLGFFPV